MTLFTMDIPVRFQHSDPAGIVFYPRYFEMIDQMVEDWFAEALGVDFRTLHAEQLCGVPTVRIECDFKRPSRLGEVLTFSLSVAALGKSSFTLGPAPIPRKLRLAMERYCETGGNREVA